MLKRLTKAPNSGSFSYNEILKGSQGINFLSTEKMAKTLSNFDRRKSWKKGKCGFHSLIHRPQTLASDKNYNFVQSTIMKRKIKIQFDPTGVKLKRDSESPTGTLNYVETRGGLGIFKVSCLTHVLHNALI